MILLALWLYGQVTRGPHDAPATVAQATPSADPTDSPDPSVADMSKVPMIGEKGTIGSAGPVACPATKEKLDAMIDAISKHDNDGYQEALVPDGSVLAKGDRVLVLDHGGMLGEAIRVRILSGQYAHAACWTESARRASSSEHPQATVRPLERANQLRSSCTRGRPLPAGRLAARGSTARAPASAGQGGPLRGKRSARLSG